MLRFRFAFWVGIAQSCVLFFSPLPAGWYRVSIWALLRWTLIRWLNGVGLILHLMLLFSSLYLTSIQRKYNCNYINIPFFIKLSAYFFVYTWTHSFPFYSQVIIHCRHLHLFWCPNYAQFGQWEPMQAGFWLRVPPFFEYSLAFRSQCVVLPLLYSAMAPKSPGYNVLFRSIGFWVCHCCRARSEAEPRGTHLKAHGYTPWPWNFSIYLHIPETWRPQPDLWFCSNTTRFLPLLPLPLCVSPPSTVTHTVSKEATEGTLLLSCHGGLLALPYLMSLGLYCPRRTRKEREKKEEKELQWVFEENTMLKKKSDLQNQVTGNP